MEGITPEAIFGGAVLLGLLALIIKGTIRLEREVEAKDKVIELKDETIEQHVQTIATLTQRDEITHHLLQELRDLAIKNSEVAP